MTSFAKLIGFKSNTFSKNGIFIKKYYDISKEHWERILKASLLFSEQEIGPKVISYEKCESYGSITYRSVISIMNKLEHKSLKIEHATKGIMETIKRMHKLGYAHGDLNAMNIGYLDGKYYILDHDTVFKIKQKPPKWLLKWMQEGFDFEPEDYDKFINYDLENWIYDLQC